MATLRRVLIVDDEVTMRTVLAEYLRAEGFEVDEASDGVQGLQRARVTSPDVAVVDVRMPVMDGRAMLTEWKQDDVLGAIPVVLISATPGLPEVARQTGARATLAKPFDMDALRAIIQQVLARPSPPPARPVLPAQ